MFTYLQRKTGHATSQARRLVDIAALRLLAHYDNGSLGFVFARKREPCSPLDTTPVYRTLIFFPQTFTFIDLQMNELEQLLEGMEGVFQRSYQPVRHSDAGCVRQMR